MMQLSVRIARRRARSTTPSDAYVIDNYGLRLLNLSNAADVQRLLRDGYMDETEHAHLVSCVSEFDMHGRQDPSALLSALLPWSARISSSNSELKRWMNGLSAQEETTGAIRSNGRGKRKRAEENATVAEAQFHNVAAQVCA